VISWRWQTTEVTTKHECTEEPVTRDEDESEADGADSEQQVIPDLQLGE